MTDGERPGEPDQTTRGSPEMAAAAPRMIGRFHLIRVLATGGMGIVYLAVQDRPHRAVALKLMSRRIESASTARRFEFESQVLGHLHHPGIAQVYDAGVHDDGAGPVPYFVMEYIPNAKSITEYATANELDLREKIELFARVCDAVDHGHQNGIIHRDLKPTNILVDSAGNPKVIDFGVARATDSDLAGTFRTDVGELVGTVQYMSPEQIEANPDDIDARSDVYALGVVLYELLCDELPYDLGKKSIFEATRVIREAAPTRISAVNRALRGDIETIVVTAMHRTRQRRYRSAADLAMDLRRFLRDEAITARRDHAGEVVRTKARREIVKHPLVSWMLAVLLAGLIAWYGGVPIVHRWTPLHRVIERAIMLNVTPAALGGLPESVRVVAITDDTDLAALAQRGGLAPAALGDVTDLRRFHGRLMERLSRAGPRAVVFDIAFPAVSPSDDAFIVGVEALLARDVDVIVAVPNWRRDEHGVPDTSPAILASGVRWGSTTGIYNATGPWSLDLVVDRGVADPMPSLALVAYAAQRKPRAAAAVELDGEWGVVDVQYWEESPSVPRARRVLGPPERIELSGVHAETRADARLGLEKGDVVGSYLLTLPDDDALAAISVEYADVFSATDEQLRAWFTDRTVVVGNTRGDVDRHPHPDGRRVYGCYAHAVAIDALARAATVRFPRPWQIVATLLGGAAVGGLVGVSIGRAPWRRAAILALLALFGVIASILAYRDAAYLFNPVIPLLAMIIAAELATRIVRIRATRTPYQHA